MKTVTVIGAGLAGCEAAYQLAKRGVEVELVEMRPERKTPAHETGNFAELVCSNSLRGNHLNQAVGVLKAEMRLLDSLIMQAAEHAKVPAGSALAVDRAMFSSFIEEKLTAMPNVKIIRRVQSEIPKTPAIIATGPLTDGELLETLEKRFGEALHFYDAAAPIIRADSINYDVCYKKSRYDKGTADYINCPMDKETYLKFHDALINAKCTNIKDFEMNVFEGCMPVETMASRGVDTLLFGPLKPVGLTPDNGEKPHAVVQLRQDDIRGSMLNMVGFQTHLTFPEQKRIIRMIPGLENAVILRYGVMHRNSYIKAPNHLNATYALKEDPFLAIAGQLSGVEGYVESAASGLVAAIMLAHNLSNNPIKPFPLETVIGAQADYIAHADANHFQPMNANFGLLPALEKRVPKKFRKEKYAERALDALKVYIEEVKP